MSVEQNTPEKTVEPTLPDKNLIENSQPEVPSKNVSQSVEHDEQEKNSNKATTPESSQPSGTAQTAEQTIDNNEQTLKAPTTSMEIHHSHKHHKSNWKDYLFEFLMLFLAVTAGFFVENRREYYIEHERAKQFSKQLLADLRLDSALLENRNRDIQLRQEIYDSLFYLLTEKEAATDKEVLEILLPLTYVFDIPSTATTYSQMKTSGSLRYIENVNLVANLQQYYDVLLPRSIKIADVSLDYFSRHINPFYLKHIRIQDYDSFNDSLVNKNPIIMERSKQTDQELANIMGGYLSLLKIQVVAMNDPALNKVKETMAILKEEYHLD